MRSRSLTRVVVATLAFLVAVASHAAPRAAVLDFALADSPGSFDPVVADFSHAVQARLLENQDFEWVERQELDRITQESDQAGLGRTDAATAVRLGHLMRADLLLRGDIAVADSKGTLTLEVIDLRRAEVLATGAVAVTPNADQRVRPTAAEIAAAGTRALQLLADARSQLAKMGTERVIAALYFRNISRTDRLNFVEAKLKTALEQAVGAASGTRLLHFPRADDAGEEASLVLSGLTDTDPDAWQHAADAYVWGSIQEEGADGTAFEDVPVKMTVQVWDGRSAAHEVTWAGPAKSLDAGIAQLAKDTLVAVQALPKEGPRSPEERQRVAADLKKRADEAGRQLQQNRNTPGVGGISFMKTAGARQLYAYQLGLLEIACFFDPLNRGLQDARLQLAWNGDNPTRPLASFRGNWQRLGDYQVQARRFSRRADGSPDPAWASLQTTTMTSFAQELNYAESDAARHRMTAGEIHRQVISLSANWSRVVVAAHQDKTATAEQDEQWAKDLASFLTLLGEPVARRNLIEEVWPTLTKPIGTFLKKGESAQLFLDTLCSTYDAFGEYDRAAALLDAAWKAGRAPGQTANRPPPPRRVDRPWKPAMMGYGGWGASIPAPAALPALEASVREINPWPGIEHFQFDRESGLQRMPNAVIDSLLWQDGRLWISQSAKRVPPSVGPANPQGNHAVWRYDPALHEAEYITPQLGGHSGARGIIPSAGDLWFVWDVDGVWQWNAAKGVVRRYRTEDGLMSLRLQGGLKSGDDLYVLGGLAPNFFINRLETATGKWSGIQIPAGGGPGGNGTGMPTPSPQLAVYGDWIGTATPAVHFYHVSAGAWDDSLVAASGVPTSGTTPLQVPPQLSADEKGFWVGSMGRMVNLNPGDPAARKEILLPGIPLATTHHGPWLWVVLSDMAGKPSLVLIDKRAGACVGAVPLPEGRWDKIVATDDHLWVAGVGAVHEVALGEPRPAGTKGEANEPADHPLLRAAWHGNDAGVTTALAQQAKVDEGGAAGWTPLLSAASAGRIDLVRQLLKAGANPNALTREGESALQLAAQRGDIAMVDVLLKQGANPNLLAPVILRGLTASRLVVADVSAPSRSGVVTAQATGLKAVVTPEGDVVLTWQEHASPDCRYQIIRNTFGVANLPAGLGRWRDQLPPAGEEATYQVFAAVEEYLGDGQDVPTVTIAVPAKPTAPNVVRLAQEGAGNHDLNLPAVVAAQTPLMAAAAAGRDEVVKQLLAQKADPNLRDAQGATALVYAVRAGKYEAARLLLAGGADASIAVETGETAASRTYQRHDDEAIFREIMAALPAAARTREASSLALEAGRNGQIKDLELFRSLGGKFDGFTASGESALGFAAQANQVETAAWLWQQGFPVGQKIRTPGAIVPAEERVLAAAVYHDNVALLTALLDAGADLNASVGGEPLVVVAASRKSFAALVLLRDRGADLHRKSSVGKEAATFLTPAEAKQYLAATEESHWPLPHGSGLSSDAWLTGAPADPARQAATEKLVLACRAGDLTAAKGAVAAGAQLNRQGSEGLTPLQEAFVARSTPVARFLVAEGALVNVVSRGGNTPLNFAIQSGDAEAWELLLRAGANPNAFGHEGHPPLWYAASQGNLAAAKSLLAAGALVNLQGHSDNYILVSPLALALRGRHAAMVELLLEAGANPKAQGYDFVMIGDGQSQLEARASILMYAAGGGSVPLIQRMIALGQDPKFKDGDGYDALAWAAYNGRREAVEFLLPLSASSGRAVEMALDNGQKEMAALLRQAGYSNLSK